MLSVTAPVPIEDDEAAALEHTRGSVPTRSTVLKYSVRTATERPRLGATGNGCVALLE